MALFGKKKDTKKEEAVVKKPKADLAIPKEEIKKSPVKKEQAVKSKDIKKKESLEKVLIRPLITEKVSMMGALRQYVFEVAPRANKIEIRRAITQVYGVTPIKVNIINVLGKSVRTGRSVSHRKNWKKAIITLKEGQKIEVYEGV